MLFLSVTKDGRPLLGNGDVVVLLIFGIIMLGLIGVAGVSLIKGAVAFRARTKR